MTRSTAPTRLTVACAVAGLALLAACSGQAPTAVTSTPTATSGWLTVQLLTPRADDGAVQLMVTGPGVDSVAIVGYDGFGTTSGSEADLVATGSIISGNVARILVPDVGRVAEYQVSVSAAAARDTYLLQSLDGYRAVVVR